MQHIIKTKILDGKMSLGRSNITKGTVTVNGQPVDSDEFTVDYENGLIERVDQDNITKEVFEISYEWEEPAKSETEQKVEALRDDMNLYEFVDAYFEKHYEDSPAKMDALYARKVALDAAIEGK
jgi:hypothetical protein